MITRILRGLGLSALALLLGVSYQPGVMPSAIAAELPKLNITEAGAYEGSSGLTPILFLATLSAPSTGIVTVEYVAVDGTALAGEDYGFGRGHLTFAPGETGKYFTVWAKGDTKFEPDEAFGVALYEPVNATIENGQVAGLILNDDLDITGGKGLRLRPDIMELSWQTGSSQVGYYVTRIELLTGKSETMGPVAANARSFRDVSAPPFAVLCYLLTPITPAGPAGISDLVCGQGGLAAGVKAPLRISIGFNESSVAQLTWEAPNQGVELYAIAFLSLAGLPTEFGALPPTATEFSFDTKGLPMCLLLFGVQGELGGMADPVCAISGFSTLKGEGAPASVLAGLDTAALRQALQR